MTIIESQETIYHKGPQKKRTLQLQLILATTLAKLTAANQIQIKDKLAKKIKSTSIPK